MAQYDYYRELGEMNEAYIENALNHNTNKLGLLSNTKRNKFLGNNKYEGGEFIDENYRKDIEWTITIPNNTYNYQRNIITNNPFTYFSGIFRRFIECKYDTRCVETGNLVAEMFVWEKGEFKPSGILKTESHLWVMRNPENKYWVLSTDAYRRLAFSSVAVPKIVMHENETEVPCIIHVIPIPAVEAICVDYGIDMYNNLNVEKILFDNNQVNIFKGFHNELKPVKND